jgi:hypothetical protein
MLKDVQRVLAKALLADSPLDALRTEAAALPAGERAALDRIDPDGFLLSSLLVKKLRFERIFRGDRGAEAWFARDPERFTDLFRSYNREVPSTEFFPVGEARAFRDWCRLRGLASELSAPPASGDV